MTIYVIFRYTNIAKFNPGTVSVNAIIRYTNGQRFNLVIVSIVVNNGRGDFCKFSGYICNVNKSEDINVIFFVQKQTLDFIIYVIEN